jgi:two-component system OmpR family sensor kinase
VGRLFWKCFLATWATLVLAGLVTFSAVRLYRLADVTDGGFHGGPGAQYELEAAEAVLRRAGPGPLGAILDDTDSPMIVVGPDGRELRGRQVAAPPGPASAQPSPPSRDGIRRVATPHGTYTLFMPGGPDPAPRTGGILPPPPGPPEPWEPLAFALLASVTLSALLAWYLARPVKGLRDAFAAMAEGRLDTRVGGLMRRGDEFSELGHSFDRMAEKLQTLILAQRRLLHDVSHELRSPLGRLQVALGIVRQDPARLDGALARMEREVERLDGLIGEILTLSRLNSGVEGEAQELADVGEVVEAIVHDARFEAIEKGCEVRLDELARVHVTGRPRLISRAVENVIRNALRFAPPGSAVDVEVGFSEGFAVISIRDHGPGIPEDELAAVFEPFHRGRVNGDSSGFGLGLAIARGAAELHGGSIIARNMPGGGLKVEIRLPSEDAVQ